MLFIIDVMNTTQKADSARSFRRWVGGAVMAIAVPGVIALGSAASAYADTSEVIGSPEHSSVAQDGQDHNFHNGHAHGGGQYFFHAPDPSTPASAHPVFPAQDHDLGTPGRHHSGGHHR